MWNRRELTPLGRITVVKSLLLPLLTHLFIYLPNPADNVLQKINKMFSNFVWQGPNKIKGNVVVKTYEQGGLKLTDISEYMKSLKLSWLRKMIKNSSNKCYYIPSKSIYLEKFINFETKFREKYQTFDGHLYLHDLNHFTADESKILDSYGDYDDYEDDEDDEGDEWKSTD